MTDAQVFTLRRAVTTALGQTPLHRAFEVLAPSERRRAWALIGAWCDHDERLVDQMLAAVDAKEKEAA